MNQITPDTNKVEQSSKTAFNLDHRLAFSLRETASILGISPSSAYRLIERGQLRTAPGLRRKLIGREELMRFLRA